LEACDGQTDGRTDGIAVANTALAMRALRRAVKIEHMQMTRYFSLEDNKTTLSIDIAVSADIRVLREEKQENPRRWINTRIWHGNSS